MKITAFSRSRIAFIRVFPCHPRLKKHPHITPKGLTRFKFCVEGFTQTPHAKKQAGQLP
jgi:hypothetical protein